MSTIPKMANTIHTLSTQLENALRIGVEALNQIGWKRWIAGNGGFIGMMGFEAGAPVFDLYKYLTLLQILLPNRQNDLQEIGEIK